MQRSMWAKSLTVYKSTLIIYLIDISMFFYSNSGEKLERVRVKIISFRDNTKSRNESEDDKYLYVLSSDWESNIFFFFLILSFSKSEEQLEGMRVNIIDSFRYNTMTAATVSPFECTVFNNLYTALFFLKFVEQNWWTQWLKRKKNRLQFQEEHTKHYCDARQRRQKQHGR